VLEVPEDSIECHILGKLHVAIAVTVGSVWYSVQLTQKPIFPADCCCLRSSDCLGELFAQWCVVGRSQSVSRELANTGLGDAAQHDG
jgi:hypothetical protein